MSKSWLPLPIFRNSLVTIKIYNMLDLQKLRNELAILRVSFNEAILYGNSIDQIRKVYMQIKGIQQNIRETKLTFSNVKETAAAK